MSETHPITKCKHGETQFPFICLCCKVEKLSDICKDQDAKITALEAVLEAARKIESQYGYAGSHINTHGLTEAIANYDSKYGKSDKGGKG